MPLGVIMSKKSDGESLAAKRTFVGRSPRPCERAEQAEPERFFFGHEKLMPISIGMTRAGKGGAASSAARQPEMNALRRKKMCR